MSNILLDALDKQPLICAEGFLFEMERRGYLTSGEFVPEVALEYPKVLENLHKEFQHAGSNIVEAFTYNGHREKLRVINKEHLLEPLNRAALKIARKVADTAPEGTGINLMAGNISNSNIWEQNNKNVQSEIRSMFAEMIKWAKEEKADFVSLACNIQLLLRCVSKIKQLRFRDRALVCSTIYDSYINLGLQKMTQMRNCCRKPSHLLVSTPQPV